VSKTTAQAAVARNRKPAGAAVIDLSRARTAREPTAESAVGRALEDLNAKEQLPPISPKDVKALGQILNWNILVEPYIPRYKGRLAVANTVGDAERVLAKQGRIVQIGAFAWQSRTNAGLNLADEPNRPKVGDIVLFEMYAGQEVHLRSGHMLRILTDTECLMVIRDPERIRGYL
jgi:co-chaperonin GroES (HSP10)